MTDTRKVNISIAVGQTPDRSSLSGRQDEIGGERNTVDASQAGIPVRMRKYLFTLSVL